ncbi:hypothetical protein TNCV_4063051 [Trichonephila clavipes]|nr:hypothetical protein TNCV_4063051 [Trichonephila clavipes]
MGSLVVRTSDSRPEGLGSMPDATKHPPSTHGFICRNCGGGDRGRVAIYRPFGEFRRAKSYCHLPPPSPGLISKRDEEGGGEVARYQFGALPAESPCVFTLPSLKRQQETVSHPLAPYPKCVQKNITFRTTSYYFIPE